MKILIQQSPDRDMVGLTNALINLRHEVVVWNDKEEIPKDLKPQLAVFSEPDKLGFKVMNAVKDATNLFIKCSPQDWKADKKFAIEVMPDLADLVALPLAYYQRDLAVDVFYLTNFKLDDEMVRCLNAIDPINNGFTYRSAGQVALPQVNYIGRLFSPQEAAELCKSASICIDFNFNGIREMLKTGCRVITNKENGFGVPVFNYTNINQVILETLQKTRPVLNRFETSIMSYEQFCMQLGSLIGEKLV